MEDEFEDGPNTPTNWEANPIPPTPTMKEAAMILAAPIKIDANTILPLPTDKTAPVIVSTPIKKMCGRISPNGNDMGVTPEKPTDSKFKSIPKPDLDAIGSS